MICIVTPSEKNGGILQFAITFTTAVKTAQQCMLFVPDTVDKALLGELAQQSRLYKKVKSLNTRHPGILALRDQILEQKPEHVIFVEDSILMQQLCSLLRSKGVPSSVVVHDTVSHPSNQRTLRQNMVEFLRQRFTKKMLRKAENIILLSNHSKGEFDSRHKKRKARTLVMKLGAHVPGAEPVCPAEMEQEKSEYLLFFGRIDKYKGIEDLCRAYCEVPSDIQEKLKLVIAGNGGFSPEEKTLIRENPNIIAINRFVEDGEMLWLMEHTLLVVLPYIEATQSGVLPIAYHYTKPAAIRNLPGLVENAEPGKTAVIFDTCQELTGILEKTGTGELRLMPEDVRRFYSENYCWNKNVQALLEQLI